MELQKLQRVVVDALEDVKAQDIRVFNTLGQSDLFDRVIVASGTSNRQTRALAWHVVEKVKAAGGRVVSVEGAEPGEWVLVDLGDIVVHVMQPQIRSYYDLEQMWGTRPVRVRLGPPAKRSGAGASAQTSRAVATPSAAGRAGTGARRARASSEAKAPAPRQGGGGAPVATRAGKAARTPSADRKAESTGRRVLRSSKSAAKTPRKAPARSVAAKGTGRRARR